MIIGQDYNRLFGMQNVSLRKSEIYVNKSRGISCNYDFSNKNKWPIGSVILEQLKKDSQVVFFFNLIFFFITKKALLLALFLAFLRRPHWTNQFRLRRETKKLCDQCVQSWAKHAVKKGFKLTVDSCIFRVKKFLKIELKDWKLFGHAG
jgi:hypothetical protein